MKTLLALLILVSVPGRCFQEDREETITRSIRFPDSQGSRSLLVDNVQGSIQVSTYDGETIEMKAVRKTKAESDVKFLEAGEDVRLDVRDKRNRIELVVEAPWRNRWDGVNRYGYRYYGYDVTIDFEIKVPRAIDVYLRTVTDGDITVKNIQGTFEVKNVNGDITMLDMAGSGRASTVNGSLQVSFIENPREECLFRTVNGTVEVEFQDPLSAVLFLKTFNGKAYTEFDVVSVPGPIPSQKEKHGRTIYRSGDGYAVRVGTGGPKIGFDTLNGSIHILKHR